MSGVTKNGDLIYWTITVTNNGFSPDTNVLVTDQLPAGLAYKTHTATKGTFSKVTGIWTVGTLAVGQSATITITYIVTDISQATQYPESSGIFGFYNSAVVSGDNVDPNDVNNTLWQFVEVTTCAPAAGAVDDPLACMCGSVADNDTPCTHGTTEYRIKLASLSNLDGSFVLNTDGSYNATGKILDPYQAASFEYSIWCLVNGDELEISGPALVTIPALLHEDATDEMVDNGAAGTMTHTAMDGTVVTFNKGWTTAVVDNGANTITFTYPDGTVVIADMSAWFVGSGELSVYPTVITSNVALTVSTLKNFHKVDDSGYVDINIVLPDPATLGLTANTTQVWTFKRVNIFDSGSITLTPDNMKTIDGAISYVFPGNDLVSISIWTDGVNYFIK